MNARKAAWCVVLAGLSFLMTRPCFAQYQVDPDPRHDQTAYRVRVINEMGRDVCVKIIPFGKSTYFHADLSAGQSATRDLYAGQRVLCVWDDRTGEVLIAATVLINRNGKLRVRSPIYSAPKAMEAPGAPRGAALVVLGKSRFGSGPRTEGVPCPSQVSHPLQSQPDGLWPGQVGPVWTVNISSQLANQS